MDEISLQYQQEAQKQTQHMEAVIEAFYKQCDFLKNEAEKAIAALDTALPDRQNQENRIKLKLKKDLQTVLEQFEKELKRSFGLGLVDLENIYHKKEVQKMAEIELEISKL